MATMQAIFAGSRNVRGALFMAAAMFGYAANDLVVKGLGDTVPFGQIIFIRGLFAVAIILAVASWFGHLRPWTWALRPLVITRAVAEAVATLCFLTALFNLPIADVSAVMQLLPLTVTLGAYVFFGEAVGWRRLTAIMVGFVGVLLIVKPGFTGFSPYSVAVIGAVAACTVRDLATRRIDRAIPSLFVATVTTVLVTLLGAALTGMSGWDAIDPPEIAMLALGAIFLLVGNFFAVAAMRVGEIGFVSPYRYLILLFSAVGGWLFYAETPGTPTLAGAMIIVATGIYAMYREHRPRGQQAADHKVGQPASGSTTSAVKP